ncbi:hypothetical protein LguiB_013745 [Lonicera macranthoides]
MSQVVKRLRNLSAFQLLSEYARKDKMMKFGDSKKVVMDRYVFIRSDYARLIAKRVDLKEDVVKFKYKTLDEWVYKAYELQRSLVHTSLMKDKDYNESDAIALTKLAMRCMQVDNPEARPIISEVVNGLKNLNSFQILSDELR